MLWAPWRHVAAEGAGHLVAGAVGPQYVDVEAVDEAARSIGFGELFADQRPGGARMRGERVLHPYLRDDQRVVHQVAADLVAGIGEAVGVARRFRQQQQPRCADAVAGHHDNIGLLQNAVAGRAVDIDRAARVAQRVEFDPLDPGTGAQFGAGVQCGGPQHLRHVGQGTARAA